MVTATVYFDAHDPDGFLEALGTTAHLLDEVAEFHGFELLRGVEDPHRFLLLATWDSVADHEAWQKANAPAFIGALEKTINGPPDIKHFQ